MDSLSLFKSKLTFLVSGNISVEDYGEKQVSYNVEILQL